MNKSKQKLEVIFHTAKELGDAEQREIYLRDACKDEPEMRNKVEQLLKAAAESESLFGCKTEEVQTDTTTMQIPIAEGPGSQIGRYKLLQRLGEGGMGAVFMAEQTEPVTRKVALKIIKLGMDTRSVVARFEAERQALAMMDHPNIAKVLDAGATDSGRPYFVMELVRGVPITEYCDKNKLSTEDRLKLFIPVCQAIQHAHHKGIIHRDVKPSNVMVTLHDGNPVPKVIDFGIAKATNQKLTEKTLFTNYAQMIGTPAYMSPEQAEMSGLDVDTRTDVYSLGVLLYELLTGTTPFPAKELLSMGYGEMQRVISETEPPKPSTRMSTMQQEERTSIAKNRSIDASGLDSAFKGDLDWIVMKSLEKDRTQRYETVNGLVADVQRHLNNEPVTAAAPTFGYQLKKFYRRNRGYMRVAAMVAGLLVAVASFATYQAIRVDRALEEVQRQSIRGDKFVDHILTTLEKEMRGLHRAGKHAAMVEALEERSRICELSLAQTPAAELKVRLALCRYFRSTLSDFKRALKQAERMQVLIDALANSESKEMLNNCRIEVHSSRIWSHYNKDESEFRNAINALEAFHQQLMESSPEDTVSLLKSSTYLGDFYRRLGENDKAVEYLQKALSLQSAYKGPFKNSYLWVAIHRGQFQGASFDRLIEQIPDLEVPSASDSMIDYIYYVRQLNGQWFHYFQRDQFDEADALLSKAYEQSQVVGNESMTHLIRVMHARLFFISGDQQTALQMIEGMEYASQYVYQLWQDLVGLVARTDARELFDTYRIIGLSRYASDVDYQEGTSFIVNSLCHPVSQDLLKVYGNVVERLTESRIHWADTGNDRFIGVHILYAYRAKDYHRVISLCESSLPDPFVETGVRLIDRRWGSRMIWSMALAKLDQPKEALARYQDALKNRASVYADQHLEGRQIIDQLIDEVEKTFKECGIDIPPSLAADLQ